MANNFTPLYEWIMVRKDLDLHEKLVLCRVLKYKDGGCFESNARIAIFLSMHARTVQRVVKRLVRKQWVMALYDTAQKRTLFVDPEKLLAGPLFVRCRYNFVPSKIVEHSLRCPATTGRR